jgi:hypothetical protein
MYHIRTGSGAGESHSPRAVVVAIGPMLSPNGERIEIAYAVTHAAQLETIVNSIATRKIILAVSPVHPAQARTAHYAAADSPKNIDLLKDSPIRRFLL